MTDDYRVDGIKVNWKEAKKLHDKLTMQDKIPDIIAKIKEAHRHPVTGEHTIFKCQVRDVSPLVSAYEESQKELEGVTGKWRRLADQNGDLLHERGQLSAELSKAQEKIKELEAKNKARENTKQIIRESKKEPDIPNN